MSEGNNQVIINEDGLFIPRTLFDQAEQIVSDLKQEGRLSLSQMASSPGKIKRVPMKDRSKEMRWLKDHRHEYRGEWVALEGDRLVAHGNDAKEVFAAARHLEALVEYIHPDYDKPFMGGWL